MHAHTHTHPHTHTPARAPPAADVARAAADPEEGQCSKAFNSMVS